MRTRNARDAAIALLLGAGGSVLLVGVAGDDGFAPLKLLSLAMTSFGLLGFADEMGSRKPLNRAGLVAFAFAAIARIVMLVGPTAADAPRFAVLYAFALPAACLLWSIALLHRSGTAKIAGAAGAAASILPIALLIAGHVALGAGAVIGLDVLYDFTMARTPPNRAVMMTIEAVFLLWSLLAGSMLWSGKLDSDRLTHASPMQSCPAPLI